VANFNSASGAVSQQVGANAGLLSGDFLVRQIQEDLRHVSSYSATTGDIKNLTQLGVTFDTDGKAVFDSTVFDQLPDSSVSGALKFFGSSTTGVGELAKRFTQITDPISGLAKLQQDAYAQTDSRLRDQIAILTDRITEMQAGLNAKLQIADALLAQLESQQKIIGAGIQSMTLVTFGKNTSS
jgi:flagellar hook-associated protein 2